MGNEHRYPLILYRSGHSGAGEISNCFRGEIAETTRSLAHCTSHTSASSIQAPSNLNE